MPRRRDRASERLLDRCLADDDLLHREREQPDGFRRLADALADEPPDLGHDVVRQRADGAKTREHP